MTTLALATEGSFPVASDALRTLTKLLARHAARETFDALSLATADMPFETSRRNDEEVR